MKVKRELLINALGCASVELERQVNRVAGRGMDSYVCLITKMVSEIDLVRQAIERGETIIEFEESTSDEG